MTDLPVTPDHLEGALPPLFPLPLQMVIAVTDDELNEQATKALRLCLEAPEAAIRRIVALIKDSGKSIADFHVTCHPPTSVSDRARLTAMEDALTQTWGSLAALAAEKGYTTVSQIAKAIGESEVTVREMRRTDFVGSKFLIKMSSLPRNPKPAPKKTVSLDSLIAQFHAQPRLWVHFRDIVLSKCREDEHKRVPPRRVVSEVRVLHNEHLGDSLAKFFVRLFRFAYPEHAHRFERPTQPTVEPWEAHFTDEVARDLLASAPRPRGRPRKQDPDVAA